MLKTVLKQIKNMNIVVGVEGTTIGIVNIVNYVVLGRLASNRLCLPRG